MFQLEDGREHLYQWDLDRKILVSDPNITEVHFCNRTSDCSLVVETYTVDGQLYADIPNILLQQHFDIRAFAYCEGYTKVEQLFKVKARSKPADYVYTETEVRTWDRLEQEMQETMQKGFVELAQLANMSYSNALRKTMSGNAINITDASPNEHMMYVKVRRKNYFDIDTLEPRYGATIDVNNNQLTVTTSYAEYPGCRCQVQDKNMYGKSVTISFSYEVLNQWSGDETYKKCRPTMELAVYNKYDDRLVYKILRGALVATESLSLTVDLPAYEDGMYTTISFHVSNSVDGSTKEKGRQVVFSDIQLEDGTAVTTWTPYVKDLSKVKINKYVNWILREQYSASADGSVFGVTSDDATVRLVSDTQGTIIDCTYNRDINKAYDQLAQAIRRLGGSV